MSYLIFLRRLKVYFRVLVIRKPERPKISIIFPYRSGDDHRDKVFKWVLKYWKNALPDAQIVIGHSKEKVFCKTEAFNDAVSRANGKVIVLMDADAYMSAEVIDRCADRILEELDNHLWYVPYRHLYRLTPSITKDIIESDPKNPLKISSPPPPEDVLNGDRHNYGHRYGAMVMMFPREAFEILGCFDERFKGWGGEDIAIVRSLDILFGKHKTTNNDLLHLWHSVIGKNYKTRVWSGQSRQQNDKLANKYHEASNSPAKMRKLVDEGHKHSKLYKKIR